MFDPTKPVQTRSGRPARIVCTDRAGDDPILALVGTDKNGSIEVPHVYRLDGTRNGFPPYFDLVNVPEVTVTYRRVDLRITGSHRLELNLGLYEHAGFSDAVASDWDGVMKITRTDGEITEMVYTAMESINV